MKMLPLAIGIFLLSGCGDSDLKRVAKIQDLYILTVPKSMAEDMPSVLLAIEKYCEGKTYCRANIWIEGSNYPKRFPMTDTQLKSMVAAYTQNINAGVRKILWNCRMYPSVGSDRCLSD